MIDERKRVLIAAPSLAEILRNPSNKPLPRVLYVEVVAFDGDAAKALGDKMPFAQMQSLAAGSGLTKNYFKYDALIVACAIRHRAEVLITTDANQTSLATLAKLKTASPSQYLVSQGNLFGNK